MCAIILQYLTCIGLVGSAAADWVWSWLAGAAADAPEPEFDVTVTFSKPGIDDNLKQNWSFLFVSRHVELLIQW